MGGGRKKTKKRRKQKRGTTTKGQEGVFFLPISTGGVWGKGAHRGRAAAKQQSTRPKTRNNTHRCWVGGGGVGCSPPLVVPTPSTALFMYNHIYFLSGAPPDTHTPQKEILQLVQSELDRGVPSTFHWTVLQVRTSSFPLSLSLLSLSLSLIVVCVCVSPSSSPCLRALPSPVSHSLYRLLCLLLSKQSATPDAGAGFASGGAVL